MEWRENQVQIKLTLLVVIGILGIITICIFTNKAFQSLRATVNEFHYPDQKIRTLNSLLDQTNNSDQYLRLYAITKKSAYLKKYDESLDSINKLFASYRKYTKADSFKNNQIDTIQMWWNNKVKDNKTLLKLNSDKPDILVIGKLLDDSKDTTIFSTQINNEKTIRDSLVIVKKIPFNQEQKTGMLHKVKKLFEKKDDEFVLDSSAMDIQLFSYTYKKQDTTITDTLVKIDPYNKAVTTSVKNVLQERLVYDTIINLKRLSIIEKDFIIRNRIDKQIKIIQKQEQADAENNIAEIQNISTKAINKIFIVFLIILLACLCLYGLLVLDTYRIKRYEQSLIREKQNYRDLADNRSEFLSMMAHELRTPLQSIIGFSDLLHNPKNKAANKSPHYSEIIKKSSSHLLQTINLLLDRSKIDAGKIELEHIPFNLSECLYEVFESLSIQASEKPFLYTIDSDIPVHLIVNGDSFRLKQVLYNLLSNAIKFTNQGKVSLTCRLIQDQEDSVRVNFKIADTGIGIPKEKIKKLFEKYEQLDKSTVRLFGGTGLGLVITKKILELFHSYLTVQSNENTGTTFLFNLTFEKSKAVPPISPPELIHTHATLLIIDDDNYSLLYAYQLIHESFESVYIASSIADGLQIIENNTPDIILCDLHVNNILGTTLLDYIEEKTKIIFTSADHDYLNKLKKQNFHILPKPFTGEDLINALNSLKVSVQLKNYTSIPDIIHIKSLLEKITLLEQALKENDIQSILYYLHQLKTTLGYLNHWEEIKLIQKEESAYALYMKADAFKQSIALILPGLKDRYSR